MDHSPRHLRSTAVALLALFSALGGTTWALGADSDSPTATIVCDGATDTTASIQAAIDAARRPGGVGARVALPAGNCVVSRTLVLRGVAGMILVGQGVPTTNLTWRGDAASPALLLDRTQRVRLEDFAITAAAPLKSAIRIENGSGCDVAQPPSHCRQWPSSQALLHNLALRGEGQMELGVHVALWNIAQDQKNDLHRFDAVAVSAYTETAFRLDGLNAKGLTFTGCICQGLRLDGSDDPGARGKRCVDTANVPGHGPSFYWHGGTALGHREVDFELGDRSDPVLISGVYSEKSTRFLRARDTAAPDAREPFPVTVDTIRFGTGHNLLARDGEVIQFFSTGPLTVRGSRWGSEQGAREAVRFRYRRGADPAAFIFMGNFTVSVDSHLFPADAPSDSLGNVLRLR